MVTEALPNEEYIQAQALIVTVRLVVFGTLWGMALLLLDRPGDSAADPYIFNTRVTLWLFLVEVLIGLYSVRYAAMDSYPITKRATFLLAECATQSWMMATYVAVNLLIRYVVVTLLTGGAVYLLGNGYLTRLVPFGMTAGFYVACLYRLSSMASPSIIRGTHIGGFREAIHRAKMIVLQTRFNLVDEMRAQGVVVAEPQNLKVLSTPIGGVVLPTVSLEPHYLFLATTNSGKTLSVRMLIQSVLMPRGEFKHRALIYDGKREYYPLLIGMGVPTDKIIILNPADERCVAWAIAKDVRNRDDAVNLTAILIPDRKESNDNQFFIQALRSLVAAVMMALHSVSPDTWTLFDVVCGMATPGRMKRLLRKTKEGREVVTRYFTDAKETVGGIISTIDARFINEYKTLALVWKSCTTSVSLLDWVKSESILLMGFDANNQAVDRVNQAIFQRASQLLCSLPEASDSKYAHTWVVLDEVRFTGKLPMVSELMSFGRTKRVHVVLAPQDVDGLTDVYGEHRTQEMLGLCGNVGVLRLTSNKTRDWAAKFFGDYESWETETNQSVTHSSGHSGTSGTSSTSYTSGSSTRKVKRESILPSEFLNLPQTDRANGMHGFFATPVMGCWRAQIQPAFIDENMTAGDPEVHAFIPRSTFRMNPADWSPEEELLYGGQARERSTADGAVASSARDPQGTVLDDEEVIATPRTDAGGQPVPEKKGDTGTGNSNPADTGSAGRVNRGQGNNSSGVSSAAPLPDW